MLHSHEIIRKYIFNKLGLDKGVRASLEEIFKFKWDYSFLVGMANRFLVGGYRYGLDEIKDADALANEAIRRLRKFKETKNPELLYDVGNFCMLIHKFGGLKDPEVISYDHYEDL